MKKLLLLSFFTIGILVLLTSCFKDRTVDPDDPNRWALPPNKFFFQLLNTTGDRMSFQEMDSLKLFYITADGERQYYNPREGLDYPLHLFRPSEDNYGDLYLDNEGVLLGYDVNLGGVNINTWYFEQMDGRIDTLYVESKKISQKEGMQDPCYCTNPFTVVRLNGKDGTIHPTLRSSAGKNVYVLKP